MKRLLVGLVLGVPLGLVVVSLVGRVSMYYRIAEPVPGGYGYRFRGGVYNSLPPIIFTLKGIEAVRGGNLSSLLVFGCSRTERLDRELSRFNARMRCCAMSALDVLRGLRFERPEIEAEETNIDREGYDAPFVRITFLGVPFLRLKFYKWLYETGRLTDWPLVE